VKPRARRGAYAILFAVLAVALLGVSAFAINVAWVSACRSEATAVAEAAARAGVRALRRTGDTAQASTAIQAIVDANTVCNAVPDTPTIEWGRYDETAAPPTFVPSATPADAVRVSIGRTGANALAPLWALNGGPTTIDLATSETAAVRGTHVAFVLDATEAWTEAEILLARDALRAALGRLADVASERDRTTLAVGAGPYAWTWTASADLASVGVPAAVDASWADLRMASRAGSQGAGTDDDGVACAVHTGGSEDDFSTPSGGCYPDMPRLYSDETGWDASVAIDDVRTRIVGQASASEVRAIVVLAAGDPGAISGSAGTARAADAYTETRFPESVGTAPRSQTDVENAIRASTLAAWTNEGTHVWVVTLDTASTFYPTAVRGLGTYTDVTDPADLDDALLDIVASLPVGVVP